MFSFQFHFLENLLITENLYRVTYNLCSLFIYRMVLLNFVDFIVTENGWNFRVQFLDYLSEPMNFSEGQNRAA